ncbi:unnamed protein product, partial [Menidia menidia]
MDPPARPSLGLYDYDYDFLVIGGGSGGLAAAMEAAALSKKVLVLDFMAPSPRGTKKELGGSSFSLDRVRKFLQQTSLLGKAIEDSQKFGWKFKEEVLHGWSELVQAIQDQVKSGISELKRELKSCGVHYLQARGEIVAPHTVEVTDMNGRKRNFKAETLVIATGDKPHYLDIPGVIEYCITSEDLLSQRHPPGRTLVVGGSAEGLECAGFLFGLGMMVTVMLQPGLLPGCDRKMAAKIENHMIVSGVNILHQCSLSKVEQIEDVLSDSFKSEYKILFTIWMGIATRALHLQYCGHCVQVLLAVARKPCTFDIGLECVGVQWDQKTGQIPVNERDQTSVDYIYAIGSVQQGRLSTPGLSRQTGKLLAQRLYGGVNILCDYINVPTVVLTPLEYAACGLSEEKANLHFGEKSVEVYHSYYWPMEWTLPCRNKNSCYVKVICHIPDHERVVGLHIMGPNAGDVLQGFVTAMKCGLTKQQLDSTVGIYPGFA